MNCFNTQEVVYWAKVLENKSGALSTNKGVIGQSVVACDVEVINID